MPRRETFNCGAFTGLDAGVGSGVRLGAFIGYGSGSFDAPSRNASWSVRTFTIGGYGGVQIGGFGLRAGAAHGVSDIDIQRQIAFPGFQETRQVTAMLRQHNSSPKQANAFKPAMSHIEPFADFAYVRISMDPLQERGGATALSVGKTQQESAFATLGVRAETNFKIADIHRSCVSWRDGGTPSTIRFLHP